MVGKSQVEVYEGEESLSLSILKSLSLKCFEETRLKGISLNSVKSYKKMTES